MILTVCCPATSASRRRGRRAAAAEAEYVLKKAENRILLRVSGFARAAAAAAADAEWNPQENGKPSSTEYIGIRSLHQREGPEKRGKTGKFEN